MKKKKISYIKETKKALVERYGYEQAFVDEIYRSMYNKAYKLIYRKTGKPDVSIARNLFYATVTNEKQLFYVDVTNVGKPTVSISASFQGSSDPEKEFVKLRFKEMASKYDDVNILLEQYDKGMLTYDVYIKKIEEFKQTNQEYLSEDYKYKGYSIVE